ncbi:MAG TPA: alpha/beta fold hydrolase [Burkholderiales bacterium]
MPGPQETVVLLPGLWVHAEFMRLMQRRVARCGFRAERFAYRSMRGTLDEAADALVAHCGQLIGRVHLVGHSLGGLVVMHAASRSSFRNLGRIVLAGTPFAACHAAQRLARWPGGRYLLGHSMPQWLDRPHPAAAACGEIGVIAGDLGIGLGRLVAPDLSRPNDGVVSVKETAVPGMRERVVLHVSHTAMLFSPGVASEICAFLRTGRFSAAAGRG